MNCETCCELLSPLLDGETSHNELDALREHFRDCTTCCRETAFLCCTAAEVALISLPPPSEGVWERVKSAAGLPSDPAVATPPELTEILTQEEAARYLRLTVEELMEAAGGIPHFRVGEALRFRKSRLDRWVEEQEDQVSPSTLSLRFATATGDAQVVDFMSARARLTRTGRV